MKATRKEVYAAFDSERDYQDALWGARLSGEREAMEDDKPEGYRSLDEYILYISGYSNELHEQASHFTGYPEHLEIIRKIGALCVAAMETHGAPQRSFDPENLRPRRKKDAVT